MGKAESTRGRFSVRVRVRVGVRVSVCKREIYNYVETK